MPPSNKVLVDSGYLYAFFQEGDDNHERAVLVADVYSGQFVVPYVVLTEVAYLCKRDGGVPAVLKFLDGLTIMRPQLEIVTPADLTRSAVRRRQAGLRGLLHHGAFGAHEHCPSLHVRSPRFQHLSP
jgi:hypothetical protein